MGAANINELAEKLTRKDQMLNSLEIRGFRGLKELSLTNVGRINLIVGRNASGKTTLIEAIRLFLSGNPQNLCRAGRSRAERKTSKWEQSYRLAFYQSRSDVPLTIVGTFRELQLSAEAEIKPMRGQFTLPVNFTQEDDECTDTVASLLQPAYKIVLKITTDTGAKAEVWQTLGDLNETKPRIQRDIFGTPFPKLPALVWLGTNRAEAWAHVRRFSLLYRKGGEALLLDVLKEIEPRLKALVVLTSQDDRSSGSATLEVDVGIGHLLPLESMGDGFSSIIAIVSAIGSAESGICLIDEVENGIHYALLPSMWRAVSLAAQKYHSQVWATTYSYDCISAIYEAFADTPDELRVHRLDRKPDGVVTVHTFNHAMLGRALEQGLEVR